MDSRNDYQMPTDGDDTARHSNSVSWNMFLLAIAITMVVVNWGFIRPASRQLEQMRRHVGVLEETVHQLTSKHESADRAVDLLSLLAEQGQHSENAAAGLKQIQALHGQILAEAAQLKRATDAVDRLANLRDRVSSYASLIDDTASALDDSNQVQHDLIAAAEIAAEAETALDRLSTLRIKLLRSVEYLEEAEPIVAEVDLLNRRIVDAGSMTKEATSVAEQLVSLNETLLIEGAQASEAEVTLNELIGMRKQLDAQSVNIEKSKDTLVELVMLKDDVLAQTGDLADAIETLERTVDLTDQYQQASQTFLEMRRWLTDVVMMEPTLRRAMSTLEPITDLGNLRRISRDELRQAAQVVRDMRRTEVARRAYSVRSVPEIASDAELMKHQ